MLMRSKFLVALLAAAACGTAIAAKPAPAAASGATPFGIEVGKTTCQQAEGILGGKGKQKQNGDWHVLAGAPDYLYGGATMVEAICGAAADPVVMVVLTAGKGGMGAPASQEAYRNLAAKYKRVAGGPMPSLGNGYARFNAGSSVIEIESKHLSFQFDVIYMTDKLYDRFAKAHQEKQQAAENQKRNSL